jgi:hypothetical protein
VLAHSNRWIQPQFLIGPQHEKRPAGELNHLRVLVHGNRWIQPQLLMGSQHKKRPAGELNHLRCLRTAIVGFSRSCSWVRNIKKDRLVN